MLAAASPVPVPPRPRTNCSTQACAGSESAFAAIVREHQAMVFGLAYHFLQSWSQAEELAQDVFLALHQNLARIESARHLVFWLRRVTSNRCIDWVRSPRHRREVQMDDLREPGAMPRWPDPMLDALLRRLVAELPPHPRIVVTLRFQEDLELAEIAAIVDLPLNTVKVTCGARWRHCGASWPSKDTSMNLEHELRQALRRRNPPRGSIKRCSTGSRRTKPSQHRRRRPDGSAGPAGGGVADVRSWRGLLPAAAHGSSNRCRPNSPGRRGSTRRGAGASDRKREGVGGPGQSPGDFPS